MRASAAFLDLADDGSREVIPGEELWRAAGVLVSLGVAPAFLFVVGGLGAIVFRDVVKHEPAPIFVAQYSALAAHSLGHEDPLNAGGPHHPRGVELDKLHVHEVRTRIVRERKAVSGVLPAVAGDLVSLANASGRQHDGSGAKQVEAALFAVVPERSCDAIAVFEEREDRELHEDIDPLVDPMVLEGSNHLEPRAVPNVGEARVLVPSKVPLEDAPVLSPVKERAPRLQLADAVGRFPGVELRHARIVEVLASPEGVREVDFPAVALVHVRERSGNPALRHHGVGFSQEGLRHHPDRDVESRSFDGGPEPGASSANHQDIVRVLLVLGHQKILQSGQMPMEQSRT